MKSQDIDDQIVKEITRCKSDKRLERLGASTGKDLSQSHCRGNIPSREKKVDAVSKNDFLSEHVWRPEGRTHSDFCSKPIRMPFSEYFTADFSIAWESA